MQGEQNSWVEYRNLILAELRNLSGSIISQGETLRSLERILDRQDQQLAEHMRRTVAAEENIEALNASVAEFTKQRWVVTLLFKAVVGAASAIFGALEIVSFLRNKH